MRNPWGKNDYNGPWSEKSELWTPEYRKEAGDYGTKNIGEFYIPVETWTDDYTSLVVNYFNTGWKVNSFEGTTFEYGTKPWGQLNAWVTVDNTATQDIVLECVQNEDRLFPSNTCKSKHAPANFMF